MRLPALIAALSLLAGSCAVAPDASPGSPQRAALTLAAWNMEHLAEADGIWSVLQRSLV